MNIHKGSMKYLISEEVIRIDFSVPEEFHEIFFL